MKQFLFVLLLLNGSVLAADEWYDHYEQGVRAVEIGDADFAISELLEALKKREVPGLSVPTGSYEYVDYTPHLFLSIAYHMKGELDLARESLEAAEAAGISRRSEYGQHLLEAQRVLLTGLASRHVSAQPRLSDYWEKPELLTEGEFESLKENIFASCDGPFEPEKGTKEWFVHYEKAMKAAGDGLRTEALEALLNAVSLRAEPKRRARTYGMWLVDYYPYYQIARIHAQESNWSCARDALEISKRLNEIDSSDREFGEMMLLDYEAQRRLAEPTPER